MIKISFLDIFLHLVSVGFLDGFFLPYDCLAMIPAVWPDGQPVRLYRSRRGVLLFREGAFRQYGTGDEQDFARAVLGSRVESRQARESIALGPVRCVPQPSWTVRVRCSAVTVLLIPAPTQSEAQSIYDYLRDALAAGSLPVRAEALTCSTREDCLSPNPSGVISRFRLLEFRRQIYLLFLFFVILTGLGIVGAVAAGKLAGFWDYLILILVTHLLRCSTSFSRRPS